MRIPDSSSGGIAEGKNNMLIRPSPALAAVLVLVRSTAEWAGKEHEWMLRGV